MKKKLFFGALGAVAVCAAVCFYFVFTGRQDKMSLSYLGRMNVEALVSGESAGSVTAIVCYKTIDASVFNTDRGPWVRCGDNTPTEIVACKKSEFGLAASPDRCLPEEE